MRLLNTDLGVYKLELMAGMSDVFTSFAYVCKARVLHEQLSLLKLFVGTIKL